MLLRDERGGAMVEMAISTIVLVPIILYSLFLQDILGHKLDQQEAVTSSTWDYTNLDYHKDTFSHHEYNSSCSCAECMTIRANRLTWCNHTSAYDSLDQGYDCDEDPGNSHHAGLAAHACWLGNGGENGQITCRHEGKGPKPGFDLTMTTGKFHDEYTKGGIYACGGQLSVLNYLVPTEYGQEFASQPMFRRGNFDGAAWDADDVHGDSQGASSESVFMLRRDEFAIVTDTWAMNDIPAASPGTKSGDLYDRVNTIYNNTSNLTYWNYTLRAMDFLQSVTLSNSLVNPGLVCTPWVCPAEWLGADNPFKPNISISHDHAPSVTVKQDTGNGTYFATPWRDWDQDPYQEFWNNHQNWYMGHEEAETSE